MILYVQWLVCTSDRSFDTMYIKLVEVWYYVHCIECTYDRSSATMYIQLVGVWYYVQYIVCSMYNEHLL